MTRYFINKEKQVVNLTSQKLIEQYLTEIHQVGIKVITIDNQQVEQPKFELTWKGITKEKFNILNSKEPKFTIDQIELKKEADELGKNFKQDYVGLYIPNLEEKKARYIAIDTRLRELNGKKPRILK